MMFSQSTESQVKQNIYGRSKHVLIDQAIVDNGLVRRKHRVIIGQVMASKSEKLTRFYPDLPYLILQPSYSAAHL